MNITLELSVEEVNVILRVLGRMPFDEVFPLISKIKTQGEEQVAANTAEQETETETETAE